MKDEMKNDACQQPESRRRKIARRAVKLIWVVPAVIAAIELADQEVRANIKPGQGISK